MVVGFQRLRVMGELGTKSTQSYVCHFLLKFTYLQYQNERRAKKNSLRGRQREEEKGNVVVALTTNQERRPAPLLFPLLRSPQTSFLCTSVALSCTFAILRQCMLQIFVCFQENVSPRSDTYLSTQFTQNSTQLMRGGDFPLSLFLSFLADPRLMRPFFSSDRLS